MPFEYIVPGVGRRRDHETFFIRRFDLARSIPYSTYSTVAACRQSIQYGTHWAESESCHDFSFEVTTFSDEAIVSHEKRYYQR